MGASHVCHLEHPQQVVESVHLLAQHGRQGVKAPVFVLDKESFNRLVHFQKICTER